MNSIFFFNLTKNVLVKLNLFLFYKEIFYIVFDFKNASMLFERKDLYVNASQLFRMHKVKGFSSKEKIDKLHKFKQYL